LLTACSKLVDNLRQAVRTQLVDDLLADLLQDVRFLRLYIKSLQWTVNVYSLLKLKFQQLVQNLVNKLFLQ
jgi:hypothetical protein